MKKILFIVNVDWYFGLHWLSRVKASRAAGYDISLACQFTDNALRVQLESDGIRCYPLRLTRTSMNPLSEIRSLLQLRHIVRQVEPDLVHTITVKANIYGGLVATANVIPLVSTVAGRGWAFSNRGFRAGLLKRVINRLYRHIYRRSDARIIFENPDDRDYFVQQGLISTERSSVILGAGVDIAHFELMAADRMRPGRLLFASRMLKSKGLDTLVGACDILRSRGNEVHLQVAGILDESQVDALPLAQIERWADEAKLEWLGQRDDMPELIGDSILVALPTRYGEGIPRILIEAAACGRALLASDVSGCREIVRNGVNGLLIAPTAGVEAWAEAIGQLLNDSETAARMGLAGRRLVEDEFSDAKICRETLEVYQLVL